MTMNDNEKLKKSDVTEILGMIASEYPSEFRDLSKQQVANKAELWYDKLRHFPKTAVMRAVGDVLESCKCFPKLSNVTERLKEICEVDDAPDVELWARLLNVLPEAEDAVYDMRYAGSFDRGYDKLRALWDALDPDLKLYVRQPSQLRDLSMMSKEELGYEKARFLKQMPDLREKREISEEMGIAPPDFTKLVRNAVEALENNGHIIEDVTDSSRRPIAAEVAGKLPEGKPHKPVFELEDDDDDDGDGNDDD